MTDALTVMTHKAYTRLNLSADWGLQEWASLRFRVENLLDETDLGYSTQTLSPQGLWTFGQAVGQDRVRIVALGFALRFQP